MRLLLDTHTLLWVSGFSDDLSPDARTAIENADNLVCVSAASIWELAIKVAARRIWLPLDLPTMLRRSTFATVSITAEHAVAAAALPRHHGDPFDRMLVAQARIEDLTLVTRDPALAAYGVPTLRA